MPNKMGIYDIMVRSHVGELELELELDLGTRMNMWNKQRNFGTRID